jgi:hypothetical protein
LFSINWWLDTKAWYGAGSVFWQEYFINSGVQFHQKARTNSYWWLLPRSMISLRVCKMVSWMLLSFLYFFKLKYFWQCWGYNSGSYAL